MDRAGQSHQKKKSATTQSEFEASSRRRRQRRENALRLVVGFAFHCGLRKCQPIIERSKAKLKQIRIILDTQLNAAQI